MVTEANFNTSGPENISLIGLIWIMFWFPKRDLHLKYHFGNDTLVHLCNHQTLMTLWSTQPRCKAHQQQVPIQWANLRHAKKPCGFPTNKHHLRCLKVKHIVGARKVKKVLYNFSCSSLLMVPLMYLSKKNEQANMTGIKHLQLKSCCEVMHKMKYVCGY